MVFGDVKVCEKVSKMHEKQQQNSEKWGNWRLFPV